MNPVSFPVCALCVLPVCATPLMPSVWRAVALVTLALCIMHLRLPRLARMTLPEAAG